MRTICVINCWGTLTLCLYLGNKLLRRHTEGRGPNVHPLALVQPGEGDHPAWPLHPLHLPQPEHHHPVVLSQSHHAPPVRHGEGEAEEDVGEDGDDPHDDQGHPGGLVTVVGYILTIQY